MATRLTRGDISLSPWHSPVDGFQSRKTIHPLRQLQNTQTTHIQTHTIHALAKSAGTQCRSYFVEKKKIRSNLSTASPPFFLITSHFRHRLKRSSPSSVVSVTWTPTKRTVRELSMETTLIWRIVNALNLTIWSVNRCGCRWATTKHTSNMPDRFEQHIRSNPRFRGIR